MNFAFSEKHLVIIFCILFAASAFFLFWQNERELDPNQGKSWWTLSFAVPEQPGSLTFTIDNHSDNTDFGYEIVVNKKSLTKASFTVAKGNAITVTPDIEAAPDVRTLIIVTAGNEKKEIYR